MGKKSDALALVEAIRAIGEELRIERGLVKHWREAYRHDSAESCRAYARGFEAHEQGWAVCRAQRDELVEALERLLRAARWDHEHGGRGAKAAFGAWDEYLEAVKGAEALVNRWREGGVLCEETEEA